jgi:hypothetical protein
MACSTVSRDRIHNPQWGTTEVPHLRIVDDELWAQVKARQAEMRRVRLTKCAECGGGYVMYWLDRLACFGARLLEPDGDQLKITLKGDLAGMLSAARDTMRSPKTGDLMVQIKLVAGACNRRYLQLWNGAV